MTTDATTIATAIKTMGVVANTAAMIAMIIVAKECLRERKQT